VPPVTPWIDGARIAFALVGLAVAARTDLRSRTVPDGLWYALGAAGIVLMAIDFSLTFRGMAVVLVAAVAIAFLLGITGGEILTILPGEDPPEGEVVLTPAQVQIARFDMALSAALLATAIWIFYWSSSLDLGTSSSFLRGPQALALSSCVMIGAGLLFYMVGVLHGGADAKGFMVLAVLFPAAPVLGGLPLVPPPPAFNVDLIPFVIALYFNAALLQLIGTVPIFMGISAARGQLKFPESFFGYPKPVARVNLDRDFFLGHVVNGQWKRKLFTTRSSGSDAKQKEALEFLGATGQEKVFVTPKVPFMAFMFAGLLVALLFSSPLYWI